ncbi:PadR family transcriptional regulator [Isachenkonia alkalipeptolytica]|uniref:PadR family transcriptional regulator n=1 Tax=Isachenkonia alkalipeptolytica TaxID=2565777 RepID=A0AA43XLG6_9CLOT|nr:PadR family transcriptional regulator [Isachenkonia alkalipeptolytica]NBG88419.1 PadR family transcriptional regulator [Isachenkonia alkalipeptolytica]
MKNGQTRNLTEPMYYILLILTNPHHGYGIMQKVHTFTEGRVEIGAGTLYSLLSKFTAEKLIRIDSVGERKKTYVITEKGRDVLEKEYQRLQRLVRDGDRILTRERQS